VSVGETLGVCDICGRPGSVSSPPPRRTLARGADPDDPSLSVIAVLPDVVLCEDHAEAVDSGELSLGWCDDERCRVYGEAGLVSACGEPFRTLKR
jgi:hypothetical protein